MRLVNNGLKASSLPSLTQWPERLPCQRHILHRSIRTHTKSHAQTHIWTMRATFLTYKLCYNIERRLFETVPHALQAAQKIPWDLNLNWEVYLVLIWRKRRYYRHHFWAFQSPRSLSSHEWMLHSESSEKWVPLDPPLQRLSPGRANKSWELRTLLFSDEQRHETGFKTSDSTNRAPSNVWTTC